MLSIMSRAPSQLDISRVHCLSDVYPGNHQGLAEREELVMCGPVSSHTPEFSRDRGYSWSFSLRTPEVTRPQSLVT